MPGAVPSPKTREAADLSDHDGDPGAVDALGIEMSPAYIEGVQENPPNAMVTFDEFRMTAHGSRALDLRRGAERNQDRTQKRSALEAAPRTPIDSSRPLRVDIEALGKHPEH